MHHDSPCYGKYRGKVVDDADDRHQGLLTVRVPDVFGSEATVRAEPCLPYGHFFIPPPGTDIWVEFEAGDPRRPVWTGVWHPPGTTPEAATANPPTRRVISTAAGHTVEITDTEGAERVLVRHRGDALLSLDEKGGVLLYNPNGSHLHLDAANGTASLVEEHGNHVSLSDTGIALVNSTGTMVNITGDTVHVRAANVVVEGTTVALGAGASEPVVLGTAFQALWKAMLAHIHPIVPPPSPGAPPVVTLASQELQTPAFVLQPGIHMSSAVLAK